MLNSYLSTKYGINSPDVSDKMRFTDGRTTDACATALAMLTQSSRSKKTLI